MHYNIKIISVLFLLMLSSFAMKAQKTDSLFKTDIIISVDGSVLYGRVQEVDQQLVKYRINNMVNGPVIAIPRKQVYVILYSNNTTQVVTPIFGKKKISELGADPDKIAEDSNRILRRNNLNYNLAHGSLKVGMGFEKQYSGFKEVKSFTKTTTSPSLAVSYQFRYNRFLILGANLGFASCKYQFSTVSDYDQIDISEKITESVQTMGIFARYNLMNGFLQPYLLGGLNFNHTYADIVSDIYFRTEGKHLLTHTGLRGFKTDLVVRAGLDVNISTQFGLFADLGTGSSLLQLGAIFIFK